METSTGLQTSGFPEPPLNISIISVTGEGLLGMLIDRLRLLQAGQNPCQEYASALTALEEALRWLSAESKTPM